MKPSFAFSLSHEGVKNAWDDVDSTVAKLIPELILSDDFANLDNWIISASGVSVGSNILTIIGNNSDYTQGIVSAVAIPSGVIEATIIIKKNISLANNFYIGLGNAQSIAQAGNGTGSTTNTPLFGLSSSGYRYTSGNTAVAANLSNLDNNTEYRLKFTISAVNAFGGRSVRATILGGAYTTETEVCNIHRPGAVVGDSIYLFIGKRVSTAVDFSTYRLYRNYETDGSTHLRCKADAGATSTFFNFAPSALLQPLDTTGLKYRWAFTNDAVTPTMSDWLTLAEIQAISKQIGSYRYIIVDVQQNSDGEYNALATLSCTDALTDGIDIIYPNFNLSPNLGSVDGGTTVTLNFPDGGANLLTGVTFGGTAGTDLTIVNDNQATIKTPAKAASQVDVVGSFSGGYVDYTITGGFTFQSGAAAPGNFILSASARQGEILLTWTPATKYDYYQVYQDSVLIKDNLIDAVSWLVNGLTGGQSYDFYVVAKNDTGESQSNTVSIKPIADGVLPENTVIKELLETLRTQVLSIKDSDGNLVFSSDNTIIGWITDLPTRSETAAFPCCEIYPTGNGSQGSEYLSQREISVDYTFEIVAHQYYGTPSRDTGVDLYDINKIGEAIRQQVYRLNDLSQAGTDPCTGFIQVNPSFGLMPNYELCCKNVNSVVISFSIRADNADIGI